MPEVHIPSWVQVIVHATQEGQQRISTHSMKSNGDIPSPVEAQQWAENFWLEVGAQYRNIAATTVNFDYVEVRTMYPEPVNYQGIYFIPQPAPGFLSGDPQPGNVAAGIRWKTGVRGRKHRGRNNLFGMTEPVTTGSLLTSPYMIELALLAARILLFGGSGAVTGDPAVASRVGLFLTEMVAFTIDNLVDSQRTRLLQRGN